MIPKIIHQIWLGDQSRRPAEMMQTWQEKHPDWEYRIWSEENLPRLVCQKQFDEMQEWSGKADILRYELLYEHGGLYVDADSVCLNPLDDFFLVNDSFCCWENEAVRPGLMANGYLGACQHNELMKAMRDVIARMDKVYFGPLNAWKVTGPVLLTKVVQELSYAKIKIYPSHFFMPKHYTGVEYKGQEKVYAAHYWGSTETPTGKAFGMRYESRKERLAASGKVRLCLNMISTDEEHIMQRCLDNVAHLISDGAMVVAYNGRREDTVKVIEEFAKHRQIPVRITRRLWERNFGKSRTEALRDAEAFLREIDPKNEFVWYIFFMDADNQIFADDGRSPLPINRDLLKEDCMVADMTTSGPGKIRYDYHWMVRYDPTGQRRWKWCSPLHEYLEREGQWAPTLGKIQGGYVLSGRDGTRSKSPLKYLEDALVFEAELKVDPENARNLYYRAQSYRDAGLPEMAERCFKIRADGPTGKWKKWNDEYTYLALVQAGKIRFHQGNYDAETIDLFERAFEKRPRRLEAPYFLLFMWRLQGKPHQGWALARYVLSLPVHDDRIFVDYEIHAWQFNWEASIAACNAGDKPAYRELAAKVINSPETPDKIRKQVTAELAKFG